MQPPVQLAAASVAELLTRGYEYAYEQGWTDGLPVIPATAEYVQQFVAASGRAADEVIAVITPRRGPATTASTRVTRPRTITCEPATISLVASAGLAAVLFRRRRLARG